MHHGESMSSISRKVTQIVVVGGGAGGLELATKLGRKYRRNPAVDVVLVDGHRPHIWKPLPHEVAAGALDANLDEVGYGAHGHRWGFRFFLGSLVSLSRFSTVGSLMGNLIGGRVAVEGRLARFVYVSLYRMHLIAIHGWLRGVLLIAIGRVNQVVRPRLELH